MTTFVSYTLEDGSEVTFATAEPTGGTVKASAMTRTEVIKTDTQFKAALKSVKAQAKELLEEISDLPVSEAEIKFGLTATSKLEFVVGKVGADLSYEVTLKWKKPEAVSKE